MDDGNNRASPVIWHNRYTVVEELPDWPGQFAVADVKYPLPRHKLISIHRHLPSDDNFPELFSQLNHRNVAKVFDTFQHCDESGVSYHGIVSELCSKGTLEQDIRRYRDTWKKQYSRAHISDMVYQLASGLGYLHSNHIVHKDLQPRNVFISNGWLKIGNVRHSHVNPSAPYTAPEIISRPDSAEFTEKNDIWSLACIIYELCTLMPAFMERNNIFAEAPGLPSDRLKDIDNVVAETYKMSLRTDPLERPTSTRILESMQEYSDKTKTVLIAGNSGIGRSRLGNVLLMGVEQWPEHMTAHCGETNVTVIDVGGFWDMKQADPGVVQQEIEEVSKSFNDISAVLFCMQFNKITERHFQAFKAIQASFFSSTALVLTANPQLVISGPEEQKAWLERQTGEGSSSWLKKICDLGKNCQIIFADNPQSCPCHLVENTNEICRKKSREQLRQFVIDNSLIKEPLSGSVIKGLIEQMVQIF